MAFLGALGAAVLVAGLLLPGTWTAEAEVVVDAPVDSVYAWIEAPARWDRWTRWGDVGAEPVGPARGIGSTRTWDDPAMGDGTFTVTAAEPPRRVGYEVRVEGGSLRTDGEITLTPTTGGTRVRWVERGDFGRNPLMAFAALNMDRIQGVELERSLARLRGLLETGRVPDSVALDAPAPLMR